MSQKINAQQISILSGVHIYNSYHTSDISSSGTSWADLPFTQKTVYLPKGRILVNLSAQQDSGGFTYYGLRTTSVPAGASQISVVQIAGGAATSGTHNLDGWAVINIPVAGDYTFRVQIRGDNGTRTHKSYQYVQYMMIPLGG